MKDTEKVCKNCYWNVACKNGAYCLLRNKKINNENDDCKTFEYRCYVCHKRLNRNARFRKVDNEMQRVCEHCLCELLVNDLFDANEEIERLKNNGNICHKCGEELFNKEMLEENDLFDDDYCNNMDTLCHVVLMRFVTRYGVIMTVCKCVKCNTDMVLDDVDYNFKGNQNNYWYCEKCSISCFEKIRYGKSISKEYTTKDGVIIKK